MSLTSDIHRQSPIRRDKLLIKAKRVEHLRMKIVVESCEILAQMLYPYVYTFARINTKINFSPSSVETIYSHQIDLVNAHQQIDKQNVKTG
jgi:hypothetical protein